MFGALALLLGYILTELSEPVGFQSRTGQIDMADLPLWGSDRMLQSHLPRPLTHDRKGPRILRTSIPERAPTGINVEKCLEYCQKNPKLPQKKKTIREKPTRYQLYVLGGTECLKYEFPHMVALGVRFSSGDEDEDMISWNHCGGSLISPDYVLTAAHCVTRSLVRVRAGALNLNDPEDFQDIDIDVIHIHPDYNGDDLYHDIALLKLGRTVDFKDGVVPACLWYEEEYLMDYATATGWGRTGFAEEFSSVLQKVTLNPYSNEDCRELLGEDKFIPQGIAPTQMCAGTPDGQKDTCTGDSGGPLQIENILVHRPGYKCGMAIIGITSFGKWCGEKNMPGVYTRVAPYVAWIEGIVWPGAGEMEDKINGSEDRFVEAKGRKLVATVDDSLTGVTGSVSSVSGDGISVADGSDSVTESGSFVGEGSDFVTVIDLLDVGNSQEKVGNETTILESKNATKAVAAVTETAALYDLRSGDLQKL